MEDPPTGNPSQDQLLRRLARLSDQVALQLQCDVMTLGHEETDALRSFLVESVEFLEGFEQSMPRDRSYGLPEDDSGKAVELLAESFSRRLLTEFRDQHPWEVPPGRVTIQGDCSSIPVPGVFSMIASTTRTGVLRTRSSDERMDVFFDQGDIVMTVSDLADETRIGQRVVDLGIDPSDVDEALREGKASGRHLGDVLEDMGLMDREDLATALEHQARERFARLFSATDVEYAFYEGAYVPIDERLRLNVVGLMLEGVRGEALADDPWS